MFPIGKFTLSILGLRLFGAEGFLWGMFFGHMFIDRTILRKLIKQALSTLDDNIRIMLPYRFYKYYNRIEDNIFGILYGGLLGAVTFGFGGFIVLFLLGHLMFDMPQQPLAARFRSLFETFWNSNWCKILGAIIGFSFESNLLIVIGVALGFVADSYRLDGVLKNINLRFLNRFWSRMNLLKLYLHSSEARKFALIQAMAGLSAKIAKADGQVSENEIRAFKKMFELTYEQNSKIADIFNRAKNSAGGYEKYAKQLALISKDNLELKENIIDNLFKIASSDGFPSHEQLDILKTTSEIIELPYGNFDLIHDRYQPRPSSSSPLQNYYDILGLSISAGNDEIKAKWKELILIWHPDHAVAQGASKEEIERCTMKMAEINDAYQHIIRSRKI